MDRPFVQFRDPLGDSGGRLGLQHISGECGTMTGIYPREYFPHNEAVLGNCTVCALSVHSSPEKRFEDTACVERRGVVPLSAFMKRFADWAPLQELKITGLSPFIDMNSITLQLKLNDCEFPISTSTIRTVFRKLALDEEAESTVRQFRQRKQELTDLLAQFQAQIDQVDMRKKWIDDWAQRVRVCPAMFAEETFEPEEPVVSEPAKLSNSAPNDIDSFLVGGSSAPNFRKTPFQTPMKSSSPGNCGNVSFLSAEHLSRVQSFLDYVDAEKQSLFEKATHLTKKMRDIAGQLEEVRAHLNEAEHAPTADQECADIHVVLSFAKEQVLKVLENSDPEKNPSMTVSLKYHVTNCSWEPCYTLRTYSLGSLLRLSMVGIVKNECGENWKDTPVVFSTEPPIGVCQSPVPLIPRTIIQCEVTEEEKPADGNTPGSRRSVTMTPSKAQHVPGSPHAAEVEVPSSPDDSLQNFTGSLTSPPVNRSQGALSKFKNRSFIFSPENRKRRSISQNAPVRPSFAQNAPTKNVEVSPLAIGTVIMEEGAVAAEDAVGKVTPSKDPNPVFFNQYLTYTSMSDENEIVYNKKVHSVDVLRDESRHFYQREGDETQNIVPIFASNAMMYMTHICVPSVSVAPFIRARSINPQIFPLLKGSLSVFLDDEAVSNKETLPTLDVGDAFTLIVGNDRNVTVTSERKVTSESSVAWLKRMRNDYHDVTVTVTNRRNIALECEFYEPYPQSKSESMKVSFTCTDAKKKMDNLDIDNGTIFWTADIPPKSVVTMTYRLTLEYPANAAISTL